jgi:uncharacterized coiled-coil DUF342 family protein
MNEVKIEAGKVGRLSAGYHFTEKENEVLDRIEKLDFGAASIFEYWISRIIRKDNNWRENAKNQKQLVEAILKIKDLDSELHDEIVKIINPGYLFTEEEHDILCRIDKLDLGFTSSLKMWVSNRINNCKDYNQDVDSQNQILEEIEKIKDLDSDLYNEIYRLGFGITFP